MNALFLRITNLIQSFARISRVRAFFVHHPKVWEFFVRCLNPNCFEGLPLTLLFVLLLIVLFFLGAVIEDYLTNDTFVLLYRRLVNLLYTFRTDGALKFFYFFTLFCETNVFAVVAFVATVFFWRNKHRVHSIGLWLAFGIEEGLATLGKLVFHRMRPDIALHTVIETSFSFPSGHVSTVVSLYGYFVYLILKCYMSRRIKTWSVVGFIALVLLVDFSRLYLGVHYLSDVIADNLV